MDSAKRDNGDMAGEVYSGEGYASEFEGETEIAVPLHNSGTCSEVNSSVHVNDNDSVRESINDDEIAYELNNQQNEWKSSDMAGEVYSGEGYASEFEGETEIAVPLHNSGTCSEVSSSVHVNDNDSVRESINNDEIAYELNNQQNEWKSSDGTRCITREEILALRQALDEANAKAKWIEQQYKELVIGRARMELRRAVFTEMKEAYKSLELAESEYEQFLPKFLHPRDVEEFHARSRPEF